MDVFIEIGLIIFIATLVSFLMRILKQPLIVGYILSGIIVGPYLLNLTESVEYVELFSKLGIAILLFIVGLNLKPDVVREVGKASFIVGIGQIIFTSFLGFLLMRILGFNNLASLYSSLALAFSSTIIALKFISDKGDLGRLYGKMSVGFLLVQDIVATAIILIVSIVGSVKTFSGNPFFFTLFLLLKGIAFFLALYLINKYVLPKISTFLSSSQEVLFLFSIAWGIGLSAIFYIFGFSLEIGALAAGVALSSFSFSQEVASRMKPLRDFFLLLFFVLLGSQIILPDIHLAIWPAILISIFVLLVKPFIVVLIMNILGYKNRTAFSTGLAVSQVSEFSLILLALAMSVGHVSQEIVSLITLVGVITISGSTYFILHTEKIYEKTKYFLRLVELRRSPKNEKENKIIDAEIVIFGYDRVGYDFVNIAKKIGRRYFVVDFDPASVAKLERNHIPYYFGDAEDVDFLLDIGVVKAKVVISTIPEFKTNLNLVSFYRNHNKGGIIIAISHNIKEAKDLYRRGASFVVMPYYLGAKHAAHMLENYGFRAEEFEREKRVHLEDLERRLALTEEK